jgi:hypothetical protein
VSPCDFQLEEGKRYIVNPGSVGYPRVGDCRSSYCIYDDTDKSITFRSLPFDCEGYRKSLREAGFEDDPWLEQSEELHNLPTLRAQLSFSDPLTLGQHARDLRTQASRASHPLRTYLLFMLVFVLCAASVAGYAAFSAGRFASRTPLAVQIPAFDLPSLAAYPLTPPDKNLLPLLPAELSTDGRLAGWRYAFEDRKLQALDTFLTQGALTLRVKHSEPCRFQIESPLINLAGTNIRCLRLQGQLHKLDGFSGSVFFQLVTYVAQPDDALAQGATHSFEVRRKASATASLDRKLPELPKQVTHVRFRVEADFKGTLELEQPSLTDAGEGPKVKPPLRRRTPSDPNPPR